MRARFAKTIGLATAVLTAIVAIGVGSASATTLCAGASEEVGKAPPLICKAGTQLIKAGLSGSATSLKIETSLGSVECKSASFEASVVEGAEVMTGEATKAAFGECTSGVFLCKGAATVSAKTPWKVEVTYDQTAAPQGRIALIHPTSIVKLPCAAECEFGGADVVTGDLSNAGQSLALGKEPITGPGGGLCPKTGTATVTYGMQLAGGVLAAGEEAAGGTEFQVADGGRGHLCLVVPVKGKCPAGKAYGGEVKGEILAGNLMKIGDAAVLGPAIECKKAPLKATFSDAGVGSIEALPYQDCASTMPEMKAQGVLNFPLDNTVIGYDSNGQSPMWVRKSGGKPELELETTANEPCAYVLNREPWRWRWFSNTLNHYPTWAKLAGPAACPAQLIHYILLEIKTAAGGAVYIAAK